MKQLYTIKEPIGKIKTPSDLFNKIKYIKINYEQENFIIFCLNTKNQVIHSEVLFKGGLNSCDIDFRTVFKLALKHNSNSLIFAHNHPSGHLQPSTEDRNVLNDLKDGGKILHISVLDMIIFNKTAYYTMNGNNTGEVI